VFKTDVSISMLYKCCPPSRRQGIVNRAYKLVASVIENEGFRRRIKLRNSVPSSELIPLNISDSGH
jgi:hypothetical protein